ncbi:hypothetical protein [Arenivirga flava]|uniref:Peptidase S11 D-alanyl-D-alanine carboxypeptidase A N-terminal domain-containing protein n=1 Tax=Arenivirga flava TaxID=1930060 RepID=A0AA37UFR8_9MICO|nr:hypothetical protein [Arenivirga flava]GMA29703.1 hypothetical protein GCM10025874_29560 [Arenivirga flava]
MAEEIARRRSGRGIGIAIGTVAILLPGLFLGTTILPSLPAASVHLAQLEDAEIASPPLALPEDGQSAVIVGDGETLLASTGGDEVGAFESIPMGGSAKLVSALVTLDAHPLEAGRNGESVVVTDEDFAAYQSLVFAGARTIPVTVGSRWTEREMIAASLLSASNNHADMLVRWAFGSQAEYLAAAEAWLVEHGFDGTALADASGLSGDSVSTAEDLVRIGALAAADPLIASLVTTDGIGAVNGASITNTNRYEPAGAATTVSRSYTNAAAVTVVLSLTTDSGETLTAAFMRQPSYDAMAATVTTFMESAAAATAQIEALPAGTVVGELRTAWGERIDLVLGEPLVTVGGVPSPDDIDYQLDEIRTIRAGAKAGEAVATVAERTASARVEAGGALRDPGLAWRLTHPLDMLGSAFRG